MHELGLMIEHTPRVFFKHFSLAAIFGARAASLMRSVFCLVPCLVAFLPGYSAHCFPGAWIFESRQNNREILLINNTGKIFPCIR